MLCCRFADGCVNGLRNGGSVVGSEPLCVNTTSRNSLLAGLLLVVVVMCS